MSYNGYKNYETWATALWIDNDQYSQGRVNELAREAHENPQVNEYMVLERRRVWTLKESLADFVQDEMIKQTNGLASDLLNAAIGEIDFIELAEHYLADLNESVSA